MWSYQLWGYIYKLGQASSSQLLQVDGLCPWVSWTQNTPKSRQLWPILFIILWGIHYLASVQVGLINYQINEGGGKELEDVNDACRNRDYRTYTFCKWIIELVVSLHCKSSCTSISTVTASCSGSAPTSPPSPASSFPSSPSSMSLITCSSHSTSP